MDANKIKKSVFRCFIICGGIIGCLAVRGCRTVMEGYVLVGEVSYTFSDLQMNLGMLTAIVVGAFSTSKVVEKLIEIDSGRILEGLLEGAKYGARSGIITGAIIGIIGWINSGNLFNENSLTTFLACTVTGVIAGLFFGLIVGAITGFLFGIVLHFLLKVTRPSS